MNKLIFAIGAVALATPALAQTATPVTPPATSQPSTTTSPDASTVPAPSTAPAAAAPASPASIIATEFPTYDKNGDGVLSAAEFDGWMVALKAKSGGPAMKPADQKAWLNGAFTTADKDKNKAVSQAELTTYLTAGA
ncbi:MAG: EF-hand protein [Sphingomonadales bacterium]|nr:EF-hand protein [Sphingomonadales bacterium]